jgi:hypothetical protein
MHRGAFSSLFSGEFITARVVNPPERKLAKHNSVLWDNILHENLMILAYLLMQYYRE